MNAPYSIAFASMFAFAAVTAGRAGAADAPEPAVSYDQISVIYFGSAGTPAGPGAFATLRDGIDTATAGATAYPPIGGQVEPNLESIGAMSHGVLLHESFLGSLSRTDDPATMRATIARPDKNEVIYLDLAAKTYHIVSADVAKALLEPAPFSMPASAALPSPGPSASASAAAPVETVTMTHTTKTLDGMQIDGIATTGIVTSTNMAGSSHSPVCPLIDSHVSTTRYVDPTRVEPKTRYDFSESSSAILKSLPAFECTFVYAPTPASSPGPSPLDHALALYLRSDMQTTLPSLATPFATTMVVERANVKTLGRADASLFDVPPGFTEVTSK